MNQRMICLLAAATFFMGGASASVVADTFNQITERQAMTASNKAAVEKTLDAWMSGDGSALATLLSDDIEWTIAGNSLAAGTTRGRAELTTKILNPFGARFSHSTDRFRPRSINGVYADGDTVVAWFDGAGTANDGKPYVNSYVWLLSMQHGKVVRATAFFDSLAFDDLWRRVQPQ